MRCTAHAAALIAHAPPYAFGHARAVALGLTWAERSGAAHVPLVLSRALTTLRACNRVATAALVRDVSYLMGKTWHGSCYARARPLHYMPCSIYYMRVRLRLTKVTLKSYLTVGQSYAILPPYPRYMRGERSQAEPSGKATDRKVINNMGTNRM